MVRSSAPLPGRPRPPRPIPVAGGTLSRNARVSMARARPPVNALWPVPQSDLNKGRLRPTRAWEGKRRADSSRTAGRRPVEEKRPGRQETYHIPCTDRDGHAGSRSTRKHRGVPPTLTKSQEKYGRLRRHTGMEAVRRGLARPLLYANQQGRPGPLCNRPLRGGACPAARRLRGGWATPGKDRRRDSFAKPVAVSRPVTDTADRMVVHERGRRSAALKPHWVRFMEKEPGRCCLTKTSPRGWLGCWSRH
jgi:hypothetical protein